MPTQPFKVQVTADASGQIVEERPVPLPMGTLRIKGLWVRLAAAEASGPPREHRGTLSLNGAAATPEVSIRDGERFDLALDVSVHKGDRVRLVCDGFAPNETLGVEGGVEYNLSLFG
jgi:hypothetical protein